MRERYILLRDHASRQERRERAMRSADGKAASPGQFRIETAEMSHGEARALEHDESVPVCAPSMPVRLIKPLGRCEPELRDVSTAWGISAVKADRCERTGRGVRIAVLDTGIDATHPAFAHLQDKLVQEDFTGEGHGDTNGHGTHCAGTIFGSSVAGVRIGIAPGIARAYIAKVLGEQGGGDSEQIVQAMMWAARSGAQIISMSLGIDYPGYLQRLIEEDDLPPALAASHALEGYRRSVLLFANIQQTVKLLVPNILVVAATGNDSHPDIRPDFKIGASLPAATQGIVSVGALDRAEVGLCVAPFSNTGPEVCAPGVKILSARAGGGLEEMSGTSMATPHVAGIAALWAEQLAAEGRRLDGALQRRVLETASEEGLAPGFVREDVGAGLVVAPVDRRHDLIMSP